MQIFCTTGQVGVLVSQKAQVAHPLHLAPDVVIDGMLVD